MADDDEARAGAAKALPNPWDQGGAGGNPYLHNLFVLLGINPDDPERVVNSQVQRLTKLVAAGKPRVVHGRTVQPTDLARFELLARDADEYVLERLLVHTPHKVDDARFTPMTEALEKVAFDPPQRLLPLAVRDLSFLTGLLPAPDDVAAEDAAPPPAGELHALFRPDPAAERVWDL